MMQRQSWPNPSKIVSEITMAYSNWYKFLTKRGFKPQLHKLKNETQPLKISSETSKPQYSPPHLTCTNKVQLNKQSKHEKTFHCKLCKHPKFFSLTANFCCLTNQCNYMLKMLWPNLQNPILSAFEALWFTYSFNATPMAPPGTKFMSILNTSKAPLWDTMQPKDGISFPNLTKCYKVLVADTGAIKTSNTITFNHHHIPTPNIQHQPNTQGHRDL